MTNEIESPKSSSNEALARMNKSQGSFKAKRTLPKLSLQISTSEESKPLGGLTCHDKKAEVSSFGHAVEEYKSKNT